MANFVTYPNQKIVRMGPRQPFTGENGVYFSRRHIDAEIIALKNLSPKGIKLWLYLSKNCDKDREGNAYQFALSSKDAELYSLPVSSYKKAVNELIETGYLLQIGDSNVYEFNEYPYGYC